MWSFGAQVPIHVQADPHDQIKLQGNGKDVSQHIAVSTMGGPFRDVLACHEVACVAQQISYFVGASNNTNIMIPD